MKCSINLDGVGVDSSGNAVIDGVPQNGANGVSQTGQSGQTGSQVNQAENGITRSSQTEGNNDFVQSYDRYSSSLDSLEPDERAVLQAAQDKGRDQAYTAAMNGQPVDFLQVDLTSSIEASLQGLREDPTNPRWGEVFNSTRELLKDRVDQYVDNLFAGLLASSQQTQGLP